MIHPQPVPDSCPGSDAVSDFALTSQLYLAIRSHGDELPREAIAALFCQALGSAEACCVADETIAEADAVWAVPFAQALAQPGFVTSTPRAFGAPPDRLALALTPGERSLVLVGVAGRVGGYDAQARQRFVDLTGILGEILSTCRRNRQRAAALLASEEQLRLFAGIVRHSGEAVIITDACWRIVFCNRAFSEQTGYAESEILNRSPAALLGVDGESSFPALLCPQVASSGQWSGELDLVRKGGSRFPARIEVVVAAASGGTVRHNVLVFVDLSERRQMERQIHRLAYFDTLTGLANRSRFYALLEQALSTAHRQHRQGALLCVDLNRFKQVNDTFGHHCADRLLVEVGSRLLLALHDQGIVARLGGDEFVVVLPAVERREDAGRVAKKMLAALAEPFLLEHQEILLSARIGISLFPEDGRDHETLLRNADLALYRAKQRGGSAYMFYAPEMKLPALAQLKVEGGLRRAGERGEFHLVYQPQLDLVSGRISGAEALLRWHHPGHGPIAPAQFIPVAEETGLIHAIGEWVIDAACRQIRQWLDNGLPCVQVAVNLSPRQFSAALPKKVAGALIRHGIPGTALELEITESMLMHGVDSVLAMMHEISKAGVTITLDDFGTGYSSLAYLKRFPIDKLKIDQSFVRGIPDDPYDSAIAAAIIGMAKSLRLSVIGEGVETAAQLDFLRRAGCEEIQGYHFSHPLPVEEFAALLTTHAAVGANPDCPASTAR